MSCDCLLYDCSINKAILVTKISLLKYPRQNMPPPDTHSFALLRKEYDFYLSTWNKLFFSFDYKFVYTCISQPLRANCFYSGLP